MIRGVVFDLFHTLTGSELQWSNVPFTSDFLGIDRRVWDRVLHTESRWRLAGEERDPLAILRRLARSELYPSHRPSPRVLGGFM